MSKASEIKRLTELDRELVGIVKNFLILGPLSWPKETMTEFLGSVKKKNLAMPSVTYPKASYSEQITALNRYLKRLGNDEHPVICFLRDTAQSYLDAYCILQGTGTTDVTVFSRKLYGSPKDTIPGYDHRRNIEIARYFLDVAEKYHVTVTPEPLIYSAAQFKAKLQQQVKPIFNDTTDPLQITINDKITARATAGPSYVKIRKGARFSEADLNQLFHHEVMVHILTYVNGSKQPVLRNLGYSAPRTTATQEGLAVFAEYINLSVDLTRLKRLALRIIALNMAEKGADLIDLYRFFQHHGQDEEESYFSAMRIFRGGRPQGGIVFYKDNVYLSGLIEVAGFLKQAMHRGMIHEIGLLFCGKLTTSDIFHLKGLDEMNGLTMPAYLPNWAKDSSVLAAHLAFNDLTERFKSQSMS